MSARRTVIAAWAVMAGASVAYGDGANRTVDAGWTDEPGAAAGLFLAGTLYAAGLRALRRATGNRRKLRPAAWCYAAGWLSAALAIMSPLQALGQGFFSAHMVQHELLMVVAAPLLILGRPLVVLAWAFPGRVTRPAVAALVAAGGAALWRLLRNPFAAWLVHALALWLWHVPTFFGAALTNDTVHALQHACFLGSALLFWQAVIFGPWRRAGYGMGVVYLFTTAVHSGALGALLTFTSHLWYPAYGDSGGPAGLSALEDQQLGGLIMWIPAGIIYVVAGLVLFALWLRASDSTGSARPAVISLPCGSQS